MYVFKLPFRRLHGLAQQSEGLQRLIEPFTSLFQPVLHQHVGLDLAGHTIQL